MTLPVFLLPSVAATPGHDFAFLQPMLARRHEVALLDLHPSSPVDDLVERVVARLPVTPVALVGYGTGAAIAMAVAARVPSVERLVLISDWPNARGGWPPVESPAAEHAAHAARTAHTALSAIDAQTLLVRVVGQPTAGVARPRGNVYAVEVDSGADGVLERPAEVLRYIEGFLAGVVREPMVP